MKNIFAVLLILFNCMSYASHPVVNLHYHLEAGAPRSLLTAIGKENGVELADSAYDFQAKGCIYDGFPPFATAYYALCSVLKNPHDFYTLTLDAIRRARLRGIKLFEFIVSPQLAQDREINWKETLKEVDLAVTTGRNETGIKAGALLTFIKGDAPTQGEKATEYITYLIDERNAGRLRNFVGVHLSGPETEGESYEQFLAAFAAARVAGLGCAAHAGEWCSSANVRRVIEQLNVQRIGHGIRVDDEETVRMLIAKRILLEQCPSSNICTGALASRRYVDLPCRTQFAKGVSVYPCNTDDPVLFNDATEEHEAEIVRANLGFTDQELLKTQLMAVQASFLPQVDKNPLEAELQKQLRDMNECGIL